MINKNTPKHFARGFAMGCADIIPGVSGGTVALILGIYERLIGAISQIKPSLLGLLAKGKLGEIAHKTDLIFLAPLAIGLVSAVLFCTKVIGLPALLVTHTEQIYGLFFGLILASIIVLIKERLPLSKRDLGVMVLGTIVTWLILQMTPADIGHSPLILFFSGMLATAAMLLPGISGSFMLLLAGQYAAILGGISEGDITVLAPFLAGAAAGIIVMANVIKWLLAHFERTTMLLMIGVLMGSLWRIWPFQEVVSGEGKRGFYQPALPDFSASLTEPFATFVAGMLIVFMVHRLANKHA